MLTPDQIAQYERDGFLLVPAVFSAPDVETMRAGLTRTVHDKKPWGGAWRRQMRSAKDGDTLETAPHLHRTNPVFEGMARQAALLEIVADLLGAPPDCHNCISIVKPPETGQPFPMHQDYPYYPHKDGRFVIVTIYLDGVTPDNGSIRFLPGSHRAGPLPHEGTGKRHLPADRYRLEDTIEPQAVAGDVVCSSYYTVHGSYPNRSHAVRRSVRLSFRHPQNRALGVR